MSKDCFVFVVCGAKEHVDTLHFSIEYLKKYSKNDIWVLTDSTRNEIQIIHDKIIDIQTPKDFDHHQASIYLKTGIHKFLPKNNRYCYLDTDIIALSERVDNIFNEYVSPITFANDHCLMDQFSPYALNCGCLKETEHYLSLLNQKLDELDPYRNSDVQEVIEARREWQMIYADINSRLTSRIFFGLRYLLSRKRFNLSPDIYCDIKKKAWIKNGDTIFMKQVNFYKLCRQIGLRWNFLRMKPITPKGKALWGIKCNHLNNAILDKYKIKTTRRFHHWNGGVFLFDNDSHDFLDTWHQSTMEIFQDPYWKTRDQGTLIMTVWKFGLQNHKTLNKKWNLIADYHNPFLKWESETVFVGKKESYIPEFLHVYHHFNDHSWFFWNQIPKI